ncbi:MAG: sulfurtransferase TusA family protein [Candidatus Binatia bacterium]
MKSLRAAIETGERGACWHVDCRSMPAPYPLLGARAAVALMKEGEVLRLLATDPEAAVDVPAWCRMTGNRCLDQVERRGVYAFLIRKGRPR